MKKKFDFRVAVIATVVFMTGMSFIPVSAQFLYRDNHVFVGPRPSDYTTVATYESPGLYLGPTHSIEYWNGGINFWCPPSSGYYANYKLFVGDDGKVGVGRKPTTYKLEVAGQVWTTAGLLITSDSTQKKNIRNMGETRPDYVKKLRQLQGKTYEKLIESSNDNIAEVERMVETKKIPAEKAPEILADLNTRKKDVYKSEYGFIAQDVKKLFPELVEENAEGILAVNYTGLIPVLLEAIKDLQDRVEELEQRQENSGAISMRKNTLYYIGKESEEIGSGSDEYLSQNIPNPINGSTIIRYSLPEGATQAAITVYSIGGSVVKTFPLNAPNGSITLSASDLAKGMYIYNLTANGIVLGSKKMMNP
jgi:hypothetical protein